MKLTVKQKKMVSWATQTIALLLVVILLHQWQTRNMLDENSDAPAVILLPDLDGNLHRISTANKNTLIYFLAPWCQVCHFSVNAVEDLSRQYRDKDVQFIIIALDWKTVNEVKAFVSQHQINIPVLLGDHTISQQFKIQGYPSYYTISASGKIFSRDIGVTTKLGLLARLKYLLASD
jgi:thiol-disulfide isomerase/thioredoxin